MDNEIKKNKLDIHFFETSSGLEPVRKWLKNLSKEDKRIIGIDLKTVQLGWPMGMPLVKHLDKGLWEVRSTLVNGTNARIIFFMYENKMIIVNGFIKKTQKTVSRELELSRRRKYQYELSIRGISYEKT